MKVSTALQAVPLLVLKHATKESTMQTEQLIRPWYKEFWAWFCIGILIFAVVLGLGLLAVATKYPANIVVVDNYYDVGKGINRSLERERYAVDLMLNGTLSLNPELEQVELELRGQSLPPQLVLNLISPTQPEKDLRIVLQPANAEGLYRGLLQEQVVGKRFIEVLGQQDGADWRIFEEAIIVENQPVELTSS